MTLKKTIFTSLVVLGMASGTNAATVGVANVDLLPATFASQDTLSNGSNNQMRQNINITNTIFLTEGTYQATSWSYIAAPDSGTPGVTQMNPVARKRFSFLHRDAAQLDPGVGC